MPDPDQWPYLGGFNFAVNPINGNQIIISSAPAGSSAPRTRAVLVGHRRPGHLRQLARPGPGLSARPTRNGPGGIGNLDNFLYVGTIAGQIFVTQTGGGGAGGNAWTDISGGP